VSGSAGVADAVALGEAVGLALGEADGLALGEAVGFAEAEVLEAGLAAAESSTLRACMPLSSNPRSSFAEAEALEAGLATTLSSIPLPSKPPSSPLAAATGANTAMANATDKTTNNHLRIVSPLFRLHIHRKDAPTTFV
jgi:hypothetical protein